MNRTVRLVPTLLAALAVVLVAIAGSATAASLITGAQIQDGTITTADVKNGSLALTDVRPQSRTTVVATSATTGVALATCTDTGLADCPAVRSIGVAPGSQLVTASGTIDNFVAPAPSLTNRCGLVQGGVVLAEARFTLAGNGDSGENAQFTLQQVIKVPDAAQPVTLRCTEMPGEDLRLETADLTSVRTGY